MDDHRAIRRKERGDLTLHTLGDRANQGVRAGWRDDDERMGVRWNRGVLGQREIVPVVDGPVGQVARTQDRARPRVDRAVMSMARPAVAIKQCFSWIMM